MSSAFERVQKLAEEKRLRQKQEKVEGEKPKFEIVATIEESPIQPHQPNVPDQHNLPNQLNQSNLTNITKQPNLIKSVSPINDFAKVPNSITREAIPERYFKGMSKNTYDALFLKTRGAINPVRKIRATKSDLIRWTGVSDVTIDKHIKHLKSVGLLKVEFIIGSHDGNWYEVFIPEEVNQPNQPNLPNPPNIPKKVGGDIPNKVGGDWVGKEIENKGSYEIPKTYLKTNTKSDDEPAAALAKLREVFEKVSENLTGSGLKDDEDENWRELAELLVMELEMAAARTETISNVPAFLTEHLRRRLMRKQETVLNKNEPSDKKSSNKKVSPSLQVGKSSEITDEKTEITNSSFEVEPLSEQGRKTVLKTMSDYLKKGQREFVMSLQDSYTPQDWQWLMNNLLN